VPIIAQVDVVMSQPVLFALKTFLSNLLLTLPLASAPLPFRLLIFGILFLLRFVLNLLLIHSNHISKHSISNPLLISNFTVAVLLLARLILLFYRLCAVHVINLCILFLQKILIPLVVKITRVKS